MSQKLQKDIRAWREIHDRAREAAEWLHALAHASTQPFVADTCLHHSESLIHAILRVDRNDKPR